MTRHKIYMVCGMLCCGLFGNAFVGTIDLMSQDFSSTWSHRLLLFVNVARFEVVFDAVCHDLKCNRIFDASGDDDIRRFLGLLQCEYPHTHTIHANLTGKIYSSYMGFTFSTYSTKSSLMVKTRPFLTLVLRTLLAKRSSLSSSIKTFINIRSHSSFWYRTSVPSTSNTSTGSMTRVPFLISAERSIVRIYKQWIHSTLTWYDLKHPIQARWLACPTGRIEWSPLTDQCRMHL